MAIHRSKDNVWVVIAAYNEGEVIRGVVTSVLQVVRHIIVVDDCSRDSTGQEALTAGANVLRHSINRGQGAALQTGTTYALRHGADVIIHFDADGQHQAADIPRFLDELTSDVDVVLGSRFLEGAARDTMPVARNIILKLGILFTWLFSGIRLSDTHNGFRAFTRRAAQALTIRENRMAHASEILHEIKRHGLRYREIPVTILYTDYSRSRGQSSLNAFSIVRRMMWRKIFLE